MRGAPDHGRQDCSLRLEEYREQLPPHNFWWGSLSEDDDPKDYEDNSGQRNQFVGRIGSLFTE